MSRIKPKISPAFDELAQTIAQEAAEEVVEAQGAALEEAQEGLLAQANFFAPELAEPPSGGGRRLQRRNAVASPFATSREGALQGAKAPRSPKAGRAPVPGLDPDLARSAISPQLAQLFDEMRGQASWLASALDEDMLERGVKTSVLQDLELKLLRRLWLALGTERPDSRLLQDVSRACALKARGTVRDAIRELHALCREVQVHNRGGDADDFYRAWDAHSDVLRRLASDPLDAERQNLPVVPGELEVWRDCLLTLNEWALPIALHKHATGNKEERELMSVASLELLGRQLDAMAVIFNDWVEAH